MPKKQPKNAFYYFMLNLKEEHRKKGIHYANMSEVVEAAGPLWRDAPPNVRQTFEALAKQKREKCNISEMKYTSTGQSYAEIEERARQEKLAEETELMDIKNMVKLKSFDNTLLKEDIFMMDVNWYCKVGSEYLIAESTLLRFNIEEGIKENYHNIIVPSNIPVGYASDIKLNCEELCLEMPTDENLNKSNYMYILAITMDFLKNQDKDCKVLPPIFTIPAKVIPVANFILQMCNIAGEDYSEFRIYKLDLLFFTMINTINTHPNAGLPRQSLALDQLKKDPFKYMPGLSCEHHESTARPWECTASRARRWAYTILDNCCAAAGVQPVPSRHLPANIDLEGILSYKEQKRERHMPTVEIRMAASTFDTSDASVLNDSSSLSNVVIGKHSRGHRIAPGLPDIDFPPLRSSRGRGRRLTDSMNSMKLND